MDDVYKMYAMSDGDGDAEPAEVDHDEDMDDEDEEVETSSVLTSSDDDEGVPEETSVVISEMNIDYKNGFRVRTITTVGGWPTGFIHIHDR